MVNMGYCRFRNTLLALQECIENWPQTPADEEELGWDEKKAIQELFERAMHIVENFPDPETRERYEIVEAGSGENPFEVCPGDANYTAADFGFGK